MIVISLAFSALAGIGYTLAAKKVAETIAFLPSFLSGFRNGLTGTEDKDADEKLDEKSRRSGLWIAVYFAVIGLFALVAVLVYTSAETDGSLRYAAALGFFLLIPALITRIVDAVLHRP